MKLVTRFLGIFFLSALAFAGCHELGHIDGIGDYGGTTNTNRDVVGEVQYVDSRAREIEVRTDGGRTAVLRYDDRTQVIYRQRNYPVTNLERGDYIAARVQQDRDRRDYTETITVRESVQDRSGDRRGSSGSGSSRFDRIDGRVEYIDARRGTFELRDSRNRTIVVSVPFNAPRQVIERFNRLREGDNVSIEGRSTGNDRFELENFV
jgi:hypothetical protein